MADLDDFVCWSCGATRWQTALLPGPGIHLCASCFGHRAGIDVPPPSHASRPEHAGHDWNAIFVHPEPSALLQELIREHPTTSQSLADATGELFNASKEARLVAAHELLSLADRPPDDVYCWFCRESGRGRERLASRRPDVSAHICARCLSTAASTLKKHKR